MDDYRGNSFVNLATIVIFLFGFSFLLNFLWEALHAVYLYQHHNFDAATYVPMLLYVSSVDSLMILGLYLSVSLIWRDFIWIKSFQKKTVVVFLSLGVAVAFIIEYRAVFYTHRWLYKEAMPTIFGVGLSPLVQLSVTGILAVWLTKEILYGKGLLWKPLLISEPKLDVGNK